MRVSDSPGLNQRGETFPDHFIWRALGINLGSSEVEQRSCPSAETAIVDEHIRDSEAVSRSCIQNVIDCNRCSIIFQFLRFSFTASRACSMISSRENPWRIFFRTTPSA